MSPEKKLWLWRAAAVAIIAIALAFVLSSCAGLPRHADGTALAFVAPTPEELQEHGPVELPYYVAGSEVFAAEPAGPAGAGEGTSLWGLLFAVAAAAYPALNILKSVVTASGKANWSVIGDGKASWGGTVAAVLHNTLGTSSPPEALAKRAASEVKVAALAS